MKVQDEELARYIVSLAPEAGVPPAVALAHAVAESNVTNVVGDLLLYQRPGYMDAVRKQHRGNPGLATPEQWVSYGPFQLQARWFLRQGEVPRDLGDRRVSVPRALAFIASKLKKYGDEEQARIAYVCGSLDCSRDKKKTIVTRYARARAVANAWLNGDGGGETEPAPSPRGLLLGGAILLALAASKD